MTQVGESRPSLPHLQRNTEAEGTPIVFIHGIKGSKLVDTSGAVRWLTIGAALGVSNPDLRLPIRWENDVQETDGLRATEPLASVDLIPGLVGSKIYGPWLRTAESLGRPFYAFAYDWRRDNLENARHLEACVQAVRERHGVAQVQLVAHSMGGLISLVTLNERPDWFSHVLFAGVPFAGGVGFLEDMHVGLPTGRNRTINSPEMLFTCPASYTLYPLGRSDCIDEDGTPLEIDFFDPEDWVRFRMGILHDPGNATPERLAFLAWALGRARTFRSRLEHRDLVYPPITVLASRNRPTVAQAQRNGPSAVRGWDLQGTPKRPGDGRVCFEHALPPEGFRYDLVESELEHTDILNDERVPGLLRAGAEGRVEPSQ